MKIKFIIYFFLISTLYSNDSLSVYFHGNKHFTDRKLYEVLNLYKPYFYEFYKDNPKINLKIAPLATETLKDFYKSKGFYHTNIIIKKQNNKIILNINENEPLKISKIEITSILNIKKEIGFKIGDRFDSQNFIQSKQKIKSLYQDHGYANAVFNTKAYIDIVKNSVTLIYKIKPNHICKFKNITINSSKHIDKNIIKSLLYIKRGDIYSPYNIEKTYKSLYSYDGISQAIIKNHIYNKKDVNATIDIQETKQPIRFQIGLGINSDEEFTGTLSIKHRNFFGNLKTLSLQIQTTHIKQGIKLDFTVPLAHNNLFGNELNFENENFFGFKESRVLSKTYFSQRDEFNWLQEAIIIDTSQSYATSNNLLFPEKNLVVISPKISWKYDKRDKVLDPSKGYFTDIELQASYKNGISNATYYKAIANIGYILPVSTNILATKIKFGSLQTYNGNIPNSYRFFAGGMNSNRAYGYRLLGPKDTHHNPIGFNSIIESTIEYRFNIYKNFNGVIFNDNSFIGQTYIPNNTNKYYDAGVGLRYKTPIGPLAIDIGFDPKKPLKQHAFHFHVGELF